MTADLHGEAGVSLRTLEGEIVGREGAALEAAADEDEGAALEAAADEVPAARWHGVTAAPATDPLAVADDGPPVPRAVRPFLLSDEQDIITVQLSRALLLAPGVAALGGLLLAATLNMVLYFNQAAAPGPVYTMWLLWGAALVWAAYRWIEWRQTWFVVTGHRILLLHTKRVFRRDVTMLPIDKMRDVRLAQTIPGRVCGYGTLDFASIGTERALDVVNFLPYPEWLYREICALKMPDTERKAMKVRSGPGGSR